MMIQSLRRFRRLVSLSMCFGAAMVICAGAASAAGPVTKLAEGFEYGGWKPAQYNTTTGSISTIDDAAPSKDSRRSLLIEPTFAGTFAGFGVSPQSPMVIPGRVSALTLWVKLSDERYSVNINFHDGWGRERSDGQYIRWTLNNKEAVNHWKQLTFKIPPNWVQPVEISDITVDNWEAKGEKNKPKVQIDQIEAQTDISDVDPATGILKTWKPDPHPANAGDALKSAPPAKLVQIGISTPEVGNLFVDTQPKASVRLQNWKTGELSGSVKYRILDVAGKELAADTRQIQLESITGFDLPLKADRFGLYTLEADVSLSDGTHQLQKMTYARLPRQRELTEDEKTNSPYGLNYSGEESLILKPFREAGIVWFREYAFGYQRLMHARADGSFSGWPYFPSIVHAYQEAGAKMLPVVQQSITPPKVKDGKAVGEIGPSLEWTRNMAQVLIQFPSLKYWEVSNEYDLPTQNSTAEEAVKWLNYEKYHAKLAEIADLFSGGQITIVENGHPGIFPEVERECVQSGYFDKVGVVNSHHYTGTDSPEENIQNFNTHSDYLLNREPALLYDQLRETSRAGRSDGKPRQHWLTEFGWDTLAGPVVSPYEQAVYLQRAWMLAMSAGVQKAFWFYNFDSKKPEVFFDGCGLFTSDIQPKLSLSAMAGMTSILPTPKYVGMINAGDNTAGYVFEQDGKLVASLFSIRGDGPTVTLKAEKLYDYLGNAIDGNSVALSMAPTYAVGLDKTDPHFLQTAYSLNTAHMMGAAAGDPITPVLEVNNNRSAPINCAIEFELPSGWTATQPRIEATVERGEHKLIPLPLVVAPDEVIGTKIVKFAISENARVEEIPLKVFVHPPTVMRVAPITGRPGPTNVVVKIANHSTTPRPGVLHLTLPAAWTSETSEIQVKDLAPGETREVPVAFTWNGDFKESESAIAQFDDGRGHPIAQPIIPPELQLHSISGIKLDGDLNEWPAQTEIPAWMLGSSMGAAQTRVHMAWSREGIYGAVEVHDSKIVNGDPGSFWTQDALELFLDTADNKSPREFGVGDHQFWFVPMVDQHKVYAGRWQVKNEIPATLLDMPEVKGFSQRTADGYVMEFFLPAAAMQNYSPQPGGGLGLNLNLNVHGQQAEREVFWPRSKTAGVQSQQHNWGSVKLVQ